MTQNNRSHPSITQRLADISWQRRTPLAAVCLGVLALGVFVALASMQTSEPDVAAAGVAAPVAATDVPDPAAAQEEEPMELHCPGTLLLHFDPGVTATPQQQTVTGEMRGGTDMDPRMPCSSPTGVPYQGGTFELKASGEMGCASAGPIIDIAGTAEIFWDNGDTSDVVWSMVSYGAAPVIDYRIVKGALAPAQVYQQGTPTGFNGNCAEAPLTSASFTGVAHIIQGEGAEVPEDEVPEAPGAIRE